MLKKIGILVLFGMIIVSATSVNSKGLNIFAYPREAPQREFYDSFGRGVTFDKFKGDFLLVNFWSKHCIPCIKELQSLNDFSNKTRSNGIRTILVSKAEEWNNMEEQERFLKKFKGQDLEFYVDKKGKLTEDFGIFSSPHTVIINKKGEEIGRIRGSAKWDSEDVIEYIYKIKSQYGEGKPEND